VSRDLQGTVQITSTFFSAGALFCLPERRQYNAHFKLLGIKETNVLALSMISVAQQLGTSIVVFFWVIMSYMFIKGDRFGPHPPTLIMDLDF